MKRSHVYILCQVLGSYSQAVGNIALSQLGEPITWKPVLLYMWGALAGILTTHALRAFIRRRQWLKLSPLRALPRVAAAAPLPGSQPEVRFRGNGRVGRPAAADLPSRHRR